MSTYGTLAKVRARLPLVEISSTSTPTQTQVQEWLDEGEDLVNGVLRASGLSPPYAGEAAIRILGRHVTDYAEGRVRKALASELATGEETDGDALLASFEASIRDMRINGALWGDVLSDGGRAGDSVRTFAAPALDDASNERDPWFTASEVF